jgi:hypothetical protein
MNDSSCGLVEIRRTTTYEVDGSRGKKEISRSFGGGNSEIDVNPADLTYPRQSGIAKTAYFDRSQSEGEVGGKNRPWSGGIGGMKSGREIQSNI